MKNKDKMAEHKPSVVELDGVSVTLVRTSPEASALLDSVDGAAAECSRTALNSPNVIVPWQSKEWTKVLTKK